jgi:predicted transcriptional regulator
MMMEKARLTLDLDPELHQKLKVLAARRRTTMRKICIQALERQVGGANRHLTAAEAPLLAELWDNDEDTIYDDE